MASVNPGQPITDSYVDVRNALLDRRQRVESMASHGPGASQVRELLGEIDRAIERLAAGTYGMCETCGDPIEAEQLAADPLIRYCIDHLSPSQARALERDLDLAARVQRGLLPKQHQVIAGWELIYHYEPLGAVSGDYVDVVRPSRDDQGLVVLFGDITGKGVAASMLMAHLHAAVRTLLGLGGMGLSQVVTQANRVFCESTMASHYATLVCGRLSPEGALELANAGHCPPMLVHGGEVTELAATGVPVGLFCVEEYPVRHLQLQSGDTLLFYTDGVTEARNRADEEYGSERLAEVVRANAHLPVGDLVQRCLADFTAFRQGVPRSDDLSLMVVRRQ